MTAPAGFASGSAASERAAAGVLQRTVRMAGATETHSRIRGRLSCAVLLALVASAASCRAELGPVEISLDEDVCAHCRMAISQREFAGEAVSSSSAVQFFDDIGCLARWAAENDPEEEDALFVVDHGTGQWLDARTAVYLVSDRLPTPMASGLAAFGSHATAENAIDELGGAMTSWARLVADAEE